MDGQGDGGAVRRALQRARMARVGILRNPNSPPVPPVHRPQLTGRWMRLRSTRRRNPASGPDPAVEAPPVETVIVETRDDVIARIDVAALEDLVRDRGNVPRLRAGIADHLLQPSPPAPDRGAEHDRLRRLLEALRAEAEPESIEPPPVRGTGSSWRAVLDWFRGQRLGGRRGA